jgi:hypothetical protein
MPVGTDLLGIMLSHIEPSKESLRYKVEDTLLLARGKVALRLRWSLRG